MQSRWSEQQIKISIAAAFIAVFAIFFLAGGDQLLNLENMQQNRAALADYTQQHYWLLFLACGLIYILTTAFSLPGATVLSLTLGFLFGRWMGTFLIVISATIGATLIFLLARYLFADRARERLQQHEQAAKLLDEFHSDEVNYLLFLRLIPVFPFWLVNLAAAFTPVSTQTYIVTTLIGIVPGSFIFANLGQSLGQIETVGELLSLPVLAAFTLLGLLALTPVIIKYYKQNQSAE